MPARHRPPARGLLLTGLSLLVAATATPATAAAMVPHSAATAPDFSAQTFTVTSTGDDANASATSTTCATTAGTCTLRAAIEAADASGLPATISFDLPGSGPQTISPATALPTITVPVDINGISQPGSSAPTASAPATINVLISGLDQRRQGIDTPGLTLAPTAAGSVISGLDLFFFGTAEIASQADNAQFSGDVIGNPPGQSAFDPVGIALNGVTGDVVGGTDPADRDVIIASTGEGVLDNGGSQNTVAGSYIGTTQVAGWTANPFSAVGVDLQNTTADTIVANVISGNSDNAVDVTGGSAATIAANDIGTNAGGTSVDGNGGAGIAVDNSSQVTIGGPTPAAMNVIAANGGDGILLLGASGGAQILNNHIGTNAAGTAWDANTNPQHLNRTWGNEGFGIDVEGGSGDQIGAPGAGNVIDSNDFTQEGQPAEAQIEITGANATTANVPTGATVEANLLGVTAAGASFGTSLIGVADGIDVTSVGSVTIGGPVAGDGNVVANMPYRGIVLDHVDGGAIQDNLVGTDSSGEQAAGNNVTGYGEVFLYESANIQVGGARPSGTGSCAAGATCSAAWRALGPGNVLSDAGPVQRQAAFGLSLEGGQDNTIEGNLIGTDITGEQALGNATCGLVVDGGATGTQIGGTAAGEGNLISANGLHGIEINTATDTTILGNEIGTDLTGDQALPNGSTGVFVIGPDASGTVIGGAAAGAGNLISGNLAGDGGVGVQIGQAGDPAGSVTATTLAGNRIGTDAAGTAALPNAGDGIDVADGVQGLTIGGTATGAGNVISGNTGDGIQINPTTATVSDLSIFSNLIGTDATGSAALPNTGNGVEVDAPAAGFAIGGTGLGEANLIADNTGDGVLLDGASAITVRGNAIADNGDLALALTGAANAALPAPTLQSALPSGSALTVTGSLAAAPDATYTVDYYASPGTGPNGAPQAARWLGAETVSTSSQGTAALSFTYTPDSSDPAPVTTATVTDAAGDTSALSDAIADGPVPRPVGVGRPPLGGGSGTGRGSGTGGGAGAPGVGTGAPAAGSTPGGAGANPVGTNPVGTTPAGANPGGGTGTGSGAGTAGTGGTGSGTGTGGGPAHPRPPVRVLAVRPAPGSDRLAVVLDTGGQSRRAREAVQITVSLRRHVGSRRHGHEQTVVLTHIRLRLGTGMRRRIVLSVPASRLRTLRLGHSGRLRVRVTIATGSARVTRTVVITVARGPRRHGRGRPR